MKNRNLFLLVALLFLAQTVFPQSTFRIVDRKDSYLPLDPLIVSTELKGNIEVFDGKGIKYFSSEIEESPRKFLSGVIRITSELGPFSRNTLARPDSIYITCDTKPPCLQMISPFRYLIFTEFASRKSLCSVVRFSKHLHSWKLKVHAENFVDSSIIVPF